MLLVDFSGAFLAYLPYVLQSSTADQSALLGQCIKKF